MNDLRKDIVFIRSFFLNNNGKRRYEFKSIDVSKYSHDLIFNKAKITIMLSATIINKKNYKFSKRMKDNDELYGSIKPREIAKTIESLDKIEIKPSQFDLSKEEVEWLKR